MFGGALKIIAYVGSRRIPFEAPCPHSKRMTEREPSHVENIRHVLFSS